MRQTCCGGATLGFVVRHRALDGSRFTGIDLGSPSSQTHNFLQPSLGPIDFGVHASRFVEAPLQRSRGGRTHGFVERPTQDLVTGILGHTSSAIVSTR
jgi:hypothetical protein